MSHFKSQEEGLPDEEGTVATVAVEVDGDDGTSPQEGSRKRETRSGSVAAVVCWAVLYLGSLFVVMGLVNGWADARNFIVGFALLCAGVTLLQHLSLDSRLDREGLTTTGTITGRKEERNKCLRSNKFYIQYTYHVGGVEYTNPGGAWFPFHNPQLDNSDSDDDAFVYVMYLPGHPEISLPVTLTTPRRVRNRIGGVREKCVSPSAGSLKTIGSNFGFNFNAIVLLALLVSFSVTTVLVLKKSLHVQGQLLLNFLVHIIAVPATCLVYYSWMIRCERKQRFVALPEPSGSEKAA
uniref:Uncharacterized protein n=1 Tax=Pseudictyota dubia TaxID=2749911 RepID=A0A7R9VBS3_9STRA|mmetsp:Transcript_10450/g.20017  ORF Transcript_10450/g.20017 Transcript_10450/m.20017 type:complete len:294 (+) Transcript_10450:59-940(+)